MAAEPSSSVVRAWAALARVQPLLLAAVQADLKGAGLPPLEWYDVLLELARAPEGRLRPFEIERRVLLAQYNLSRLLDRLDRAGLVAREACREDGRGRWVAITDAGRASQRATWPVYRASIARHVGGRLSEAEAATLAELLARLGPSGAARPGPRATKEQR